MNRVINFRPGALLAVGIGVGLLLSGVSGLLFEPLELQAQTQQKPAVKPSKADDALLDARTLTERSPDQSHTMVDVGYHFANLWFAADKQNWPLADYYLSETRSHLRWAVRIHPVRKTKAGAEIDLKGILDAVDNSFLTEIGTAITNKDSAKFKIAYRQTIEGCYACHTACEKPFLRPQVPNAPSVSILNFDPNAAGPE